MKQRFNIWHLLFGSMLLVLLSSFLGAALYKTWFETPKAYFLPQPGFEYTPPYQQTAALPNEGTGPNVGPSFIAASQKARPAVVYIRSSLSSDPILENRDLFSNPFRDRNEDRYQQSPRGVSSGSGVLISENGYIATNNHVIEDAEVIEVTLFDNRKFTATLIGRDLSTDLALIKIDSDALPFLTFGNSDQVAVGQWILAVGNPMDLNSTVTAGIVSAKGRNINLLRADSRFAIESFIQTDAAVNKGNSGGALVDVHGSLIGINTAIASRTGYFSGYSFAIPATIVRKVMEDFMVFGEVRRGFLGVQIQPVDADLAKNIDLDVMKGAYVTNVNERLGAAEAGIQQGDVIISINNIAVHSPSELQEQVSRFRPGDNVRIQVIRGGEDIVFLVNLRGLDGAGLALSAHKSHLEYGGSEFRLLTEKEAAFFRLEQGILLTQPGGIFAEEGIKSGFVILEVDAMDISSIEGLERSFKEGKSSLTIKGMYAPGQYETFRLPWGPSSR